MLDLSDRFYSEVVQHLRQWSATAPRTKSLEAAVHDAATGEIVGELPIEDEVADHPTDADSTLRRIGAADETGNSEQPDLDESHTQAAVTERAPMQPATVELEAVVSNTSSPTTQGADGWPSMTVSTGQSLLTVEPDQQPEETNASVEEPPQPTGS
jgi:hypothetical protein